MQDDIKKLNSEESAATRPADSAVSPDEGRPIDHEEANRPEEADALVPGAPSGPSRFQLFKRWYLGHKRWSIPASVLLFILIIIAIPWTRYHTAGVVIKKDLTIKVVDSTAGTPVSGAEVSSGATHATTNAEGLVKLHLPVGPHNFSINKKYYLTSQANSVLPILKSKDLNVKLVATGRQVEVFVKNTISGKALSDVYITVADISAKTDASGKALLVLPAKSSQEKASLSLSGYNQSDVAIKISDQKIEQNNFSLTPSGKVYFLSNLSGSLDVVKTNLDGTARETVVTGTGNEDPTSTTLQASHDWKYLALLAKRDSGLPKLYIINTNDDQLITMDEGNASFDPIGWYNHYFVYTVSRNGYNNWQSGAFSIKSYNAETGQTVVLANTGATGSTNSDAEYENIWNIALMGNDVVYTKTWYHYPGYLQVTGKQNVLAAIHVDGSDSRQIKSVDSASSYISYFRLNKPRQLYFSVADIASGNETYYSLDKNGSVSQLSGSAANISNQPSVTYLGSPSGNQTFWQEERDGKNALFIGDQDAANQQQVANLSDFDAFGWYSDDYLLVSKDRSELYIMPTAGIKNDTAALKITDYQSTSVY